MTERARNFYLFVLANVVTFTGIAFLQLVEGMSFFLVLLVMHAGILTLMISRKRFMAEDPSIKRFYDRVYLYLALYIPLLLYKLVGFFFPAVYNDTIIRVAIPIVIVVSVAGAIVNVTKLYAYLWKQKVSCTS